MRGSHWKMLRKIGERKKIKKFEKKFKLKIDFCQWITEALFLPISRELKQRSAQKP